MCGLIELRGFLCSHTHAHHRQRCDIPKVCKALECPVIGAVKDDKIPYCLLCLQAMEQDVWQCYKQTRKAILEEMKKGNLPHLTAEKADRDLEIEIEWELDELRKSGGLSAQGEYWMNYLADEDVTQTRSSGAAGKSGGGSGAQRTGKGRPLAIPEKSPARTTSRAANKAASRAASLFPSGASHRKPKGSFPCLYTQQECNRMRYANKAFAPLPRPKKCVGSEDTNEEIDVLDIEPVPEKILYLLEGNPPVEIEAGMKCSVGFRELGKAIVTVIAKGFPGGQSEIL